MIDCCPHCGGKLEAALIEIVRYPGAKVDEQGGLKININTPMLLDYARQPISVNFLRCTRCATQWDDGKALRKTIRKLKKKTEKERKQRTRGYGGQGSETKKEEEQQRGAKLRIGRIFRWMKR